MTNIEDGGLAFPGKRYQEVGRVSDYGFTDDDSPTFAEVEHPGMSLRDYFATHAPTVSDEMVIEDIPGFPVFDNSGYHNGYPAESIREEQRKAKLEWLREARVKWRWNYADAMLEARG